MVEDHAADPLIVRPATESRDGVNGSNVEEDEQQAATRAGETFVVRGNLLGADSLEEGLHVVEVREH